MASCGCAAGAADNDFPEWMRSGFFRLARLWELMAGLAEDGPRGLVAVWQGQRHADQKWRDDEEEHDWRERCSV